MDAINFSLNWQVQEVFDHAQQIAQYSNGGVIGSTSLLSIVETQTTPSLQPNSLEMW